MSDVERPWDRRSKPRQKILPTTRIGKWTTGLVVLAAIIWVVVETKRNSDEMSSNGTEREAMSACQASVEGKLKSPASADYSQESAFFRTSENVWLVTGAVDSENAFGASVRSRFRCEVKVLGESQYSATSTVN